ncbi:MAG: hypothetical protein AB7P16_28445 [Bradyrhizobium sp.]|uniref:hypothetical protein n=1 Tax=Bradyrhizobium sp. TaxID=376 RepID=UPI003D14B02E
MTTLTYARPAQSLPHTPVQIDGDDMAKPDVPIVELRPFDGGTRRFAVGSLEPTIQAEGWSSWKDDDGESNNFRNDLRMWERIEGRGWVADIATRIGSDLQHFIGIASAGNPELAVRMAWNTLVNEWEAPEAKLPTEMVKAVRDYVASVTPPKVE